MTGCFGVRSVITTCMVVVHHLPRERRGSITELAKPDERTTVIKYHTRTLYRFKRLLFHSVLSEHEILLLPVIPTAVSR